LRNIYFQEPLNGSRDFIIHVYCLVCDHYQAIKKPIPQPLRKAGFAPQLSDEEVIVIELCGEMFKMPKDKALFHWTVVFIMPVARGFRV
jgi:hypothetical protein